MIMNEETKRVPGIKREIVENLSDGRALVVTTIEGFIEDLDEVVPIVLRRQNEDSSREEA